MSTGETGRPIVRPPNPDSPLLFSPRQPVSFSNWPAPLHQGLGELVDRANDAGASTGLGEMAAALVYQAVSQATSGDKLCRLWLEYRNASIGDLSLEDGQ